MVFLGWFRDVLRVYQGCSWCFNGDSGMFQGYSQGFQGVSSVFHGYFEGVSGMA